MVQALPAGLWLMIWGWELVMIGYILLSRAQDFVGNQGPDSCIGVMDRMRSR